MSDNQHLIVFIKGHGFEFFGGDKNFGEHKISVILQKGIAL